jgi:hypothetical protein
VVQNLGGNVYSGAKDTTGSFNPDASYANSLRFPRDVSQLEKTHQIEYWETVLDSTTDGKSTDKTAKFG